MKQTVLKLPEVVERVRISRSTIYHNISNNSFPKQIKLGERAVGWLEADINNWLKNKSILVNADDAALKNK
ncbi:MAG: AlpA family phage regulatory protein [Gammaproteobacteria bacterium]|nr:MAG: AlpA family phage regulatory protein [Gammaproteobacteria bacterium]